MALTKSEQKTSDVLKKLIPSKKHSYLENIKLKVIQSVDKTKIMILKVDSEIIEDIKEVHTQYMLEMKVLFPDYFFYVIRQENNETSRDQIKKIQEAWIQDLAYPALVQGRFRTIRPDGKMEGVILERKVFFTENELKIKGYVFKKLTEKDVLFSMRTY